MFFAFEQGKLFQGPCHPAKPDRTRKTQVQRGGTWAHRIGCGHARLDRQAPFHRRVYRGFADGDISRIAMLLPAVKYFGCCFKSLKPGS
jgi:hypothetical protein